MSTMKYNAALSSIISNYYVAHCYDIIFADNSILYVGVSNNRVADEFRSMST